MNEEEKEEEKWRAVSWLRSWIQDTNLDLYGGYPGSAYELKGLILIVDPGNESQKYNCCRAWKVEDVLELFKKGDYGHPDYYAIEEIMEKEIQLDEIPFGGTWGISSLPEDALQYAEKMMEKES